VQVEVLLDISLFPGSQVVAVVQAVSSSNSGDTYFSLVRRQKSSMNFNWVAV